MRLVTTISVFFILASAQSAYSQPAAPSVPSFSTSKSCAPEDRFGNYKVGCTAACPTGSQIAGGGCGSSGDRPWAIYETFRTDNAWQCSSYDPLAFGNGNARPDPDIRLAAHADCNSLASSPPATWMTVASNTIAIARAGTGFVTPIEKSFMVCHTDGADPMTAFIYQKAAAAPGYKRVDPPPTIELGKCLLVDRPTALFLVDYKNSDRPNSGSYRTFGPGTFNLGAEPWKIVGVDSETLPSAPSAPIHVEANCVREPRPNPTQNIYSTCAIPGLTKNDSYRICIDVKDTPPMSNGQPYAGTLSPMVVDPGLLLKPYPAGNPDQIIYNPIIQGGCRDLYNVGSASFIVTPWAAADATWHPELVTKITLTVEKL